MVAAFVTANFTRVASIALASERRDKNPGRICSERFDGTIPGRMHVYDVFSLAAVVETVVYWKEAAGDRRWGGRKGKKRCGEEVKEGRKGRNKSRMQR